MITIQAAGNMAGVAANANSVTYTLDGMELSSTGVEVYKVLAQGNLAAAAANIYACPANNTSFVKRIFLVNQTANIQAGIILYLSSNGAAPTAATQITGNVSIPINGMVVYDESGWTAYDANMSSLSSSANTGRLAHVTVCNPGNVNYITPAGINAIFVECVGPGAGGGGANANATNNSAYAGGGGGGGYCAKLITSPIGNYTIAVGAGGAGGGVAGSNGVAGNTSTTFAIPSSVTLTSTTGAVGIGQTGAATILQAAGGTGGTGANGDINISGGNGAPGGRYTTAITTGIPTGAPGKGGDAGKYGVGAPGGIGGITLAGQSAGLYGAGGAGGSANGSAASAGSGGAGSNGVIFVWEFF